MPFKPRVITLNLVECSFCGTAYQGAEIARAHGCTGETPSQLVPIGTQLAAEFSVVDNGKLIGTQIALGRVSAYLQPTPPILGELFPKRSHLEEGSIFFLFAPIGNHEWMVRVEPIDRTPNRAGFEFGELTDETICESTALYYLHYLQTETSKIGHWKRNAR